jgi:hypothetical protein
VLAPGIRLSGRLVDLKGRPVAGQLITAQSLYQNHKRSARTDAEGQFHFAPLRQGNYVLVGQRQGFGGGVHPNLGTLPNQGTVIQPAKIYLRSGIVRDRVMLREIPTVAIEVRSVDSQDRPARGNFVSVWGQLPAINVQHQQQQAVFDGNGLDGRINGPEREDSQTQCNWLTLLIPNDTGQLVLRVPKSLQNAQIVTTAPDETTSVRYRAGAGKPLNFWAGGTLGDLKNDIRGVTFVVQDAPMILATIKTEDGDTPEFDVNLRAGFTTGRGWYGASVFKQADGRYRITNLFPDQEYELSASALAFIPNRIHRVKPREGSSVELILTLK